MGNSIGLKKVTQALNALNIRFASLDIRPLYTGNPRKGTLANKEDRGEMLHLAAIHQGLHGLLTLKQRLVTEIHHEIETATCDPF